MSEFQVGDRVICVRGRVTWQTGMEGGILSITFDGMLEILFDNGKTNTLRPSRFEYAGPVLSPVCRKIRQMEKRFQAWQEKKTLI